MGVNLFVAAKLLHLVDFVVIFRVFDLEVGLLNQHRYLLELLVGIIGVVLHDACEDLGQVRIEVDLDGAASVLCIFQLSLEHR